MESPSPKGAYKAVVDFYTGGSTQGAATQIKEKAFFDTQDEATAYIQNIVNTKIEA